MGCRVHGGVKVVLITEQAQPPPDRVLVFLGETTATCPSTGLDRFWYWRPLLGKTYCLHGGDVEGVLQAAMDKGYRFTALGESP